jgi:hypothetical protein
MNRGTKYPKDDDASKVAECNSQEAVEYPGGSYEENGEEERYIYSDWMLCHQTFLIRW